MILDPTLSFDLHIDYVYSKTCRQLAAVKKVRSCLNQKLSTTLYKCLVLPVINYGDAVYNVANQDKLGKLQLMQNRACRLY